MSGLRGLHRRLRTLETAAPDSEVALREDVYGMLAALFSEGRRYPPAWGELQGWIEHELARTPELPAQFAAHGNPWPRNGDLTAGSMTPIDFLYLEWKKSPAAFRTAPHCCAAPLAILSPEDFEAMFAGYPEWRDRQYDAGPLRG